jgi:thioredoxin reductase
MRSDIPLLSEDLETSVPGVFIAGELGGIGLIRHAINQGVRVSTTIARRMRRRGISKGGRDPVDLLVVGCGPSGIAAALKARELDLSVTVIDGSGLGGTVSRYPKNKLTLTHPVTLPIYGRMRRSQYSREELIDIWKTAFAKADLQVQGGVLFREVFPDDEGCLRVVSSTGEIRSRALILALGRRGTPRRLNVPGEQAEHVLYRLADAQHFQHQAILVVGGGDSAVEAALSLADQPGNRVTLSYRRQAFFRIKPFNRDRLETYQAQGRLEVLLRSEVKEIFPDQVRLVVSREEDAVQDDRVMDAKSVFILAGGIPPYEMLKKIGVRFGGSSTSAEAVGDGASLETAHAG